MEATLRESLAVLLFPVLFVGTWLAVTLLLSRLGGWHRLARRYRSSSPFPGRIWRFQSAKFNWAGYNNCLSVGGNEAGLYVAPLFLFRLGHPRLFIPWGEIVIEEKRFLAWTFADMRFREVPRTRLRISGRLWRRIAPSSATNSERERDFGLPAKIEPK